MIQVNKVLSVSSTLAPAEPFEGLRNVKMDKVFYLGEMEVSQAFWNRHMKLNPSRFQSPSLPVEGIIWQEANEFCQKLNPKRKI